MGNSIIISESELKYIIEESIRKTVSENNITIGELYEAIGDKLNEGLICSYDADKVKYIVARRFDIDPSQIQIIPYNNVNIITIVLPISAEKNNIGKLKKFLNTCGYYLSKNMVYEWDKNSIYYVFEPKYSKNVGKEILSKYRYLYHMTKIENLPRIFRKGLTPRNDGSNNKMFMYPERVYMMKGNTMDSEQIETLKNIAKYKNGKRYNGKYVILTIDTNRLPKDIDFYIDPNAPNAVFTNNCITDKAIINVEEFFG